ncbi:hypothetical protein LY474_00325 [Myxococcus stipitatus]|uniref:hypothetical protein n=1 Tax=Myxococcus stipitatus TaxID=83455 RepID=UPI001F3AFEFE|nr:hypothetical protein [Myxococcus stipitatus]MCE9666242.1 hypothetical protein [Myxococcus stipitatus]
MNRHWLLLLFVLVGCVGCKRVNLHERRARLQDLHASNYRSTTGFQSTRWGMTRDEVRALYPAARDSAEGDILVFTEVADRPAGVVFHFTDDHLGSVIVRFTSPVDILEEHKALVKVLSSKYERRPDDQEEEYKGDAQRANRRAMSTDIAWTYAWLAEPSTASSEQHAKTTTDTVPKLPADAASRTDAFVNQLHFLRFALWELRETDVKLVGGQGRQSKLLTLYLESIEYAHIIRADLQATLKQQRLSQARGL